VESFIKAHNLPNIKYIGDMYSLWPSTLHEQKPVLGGAKREPDSGKAHG
jgi:hypothetical protein